MLALGHALFQLDVGFVDIFTTTIHAYFFINFAPIITFCLLLSFSVLWFNSTYLVFIE